MSTYFVYAVRYNSIHSHIEQLKVAQNGGGFIYWSRQEVVNKIYQRTDEFITAVATGNGKYERGAPVELDPVNGVFYLKTVPDRTTKDNLGSLPEY
ncbi:DUF3892 domain-containing protein [Enterobacter wuhouensis]|uniref:DUF3892 domain-containing protein n=1 Tax=Enterobacter wuhouensis TaxID=2529381 RepID=UPI003D770491